MEEEKTARKEKYEESLRQRDWDTDRTDLDLISAAEREFSVGHFVKAYELYHEVEENGNPHPEIDFRGKDRGITDYLKENFGFSPWAYFHNLDTAPTRERANADFRHAKNLEKAGSRMSAARFYLSAAAGLLIASQQSENKKLERIAKSIYKRKMGLLVEFREFL